MPAWTCFIWLNWLFMYTFQGFLPCSLIIWKKIFTRVRKGSQYRRLSDCVGVTWGIGWGTLITRCRVLCSCYVRTHVPLLETWQILHLVRDPRAILTSMMKRSVFDRSSKHPELFCDFMLDDLRMGTTLDSSRLVRVLYRVEQKNLAKVSDTWSVRADELCIGSSRLVGGKKAGNSNM